MSYQKSFDVVVIGGGPAGLIAAGRAAEKGARVMVIERNSDCGRKLLLTGQGRCNLTNEGIAPESLTAYYGAQGKFLHSAIAAFGVKETTEFFRQQGLETKTERGKRVFPVSERSQDVLKALLRYCKSKGVVIYRDAQVVNLERRGRQIERVLLRGREIESETFIICTGGKSYRQTGSTGDGYRWAERMGHSVIPPVPSIVPIRISDRWGATLKGLDLRNVALQAICEGNEIGRRFGEMSFTPFGISGPIAMDLSRELAGPLAEGKPVSLSLDLKPALSPEKLDNRLLRDFDGAAGKPLGVVMKGLLPSRLIRPFLELAGLPWGRKADQLSREERIAIGSLLKAVPMTVKGLLGFDWAIVTRGGVDLREVEPGTMRSRKIDNLFFAGEVLDLDGPTGGFNLQVCWSTGHLAGQSAAAQALSKA